MGRRDEATDRISIASAPIPRPIDRDPDAPASASHGGQSSLMRIADAVAARVRGGGKLPWSIVVVLALALAADAGARFADRQSECEPLIVKHVLWQAKLGQEASTQLHAAGEHEVADAIAHLTDIKNQADDVQLCTMLVNRDHR